VRLLRADPTEVPSGLGSDLMMESAYQIVEGHHAQIDIASRTHGHGFRISLFVADYHNVGQLLNRVLAYFIGYFLVTQIGLHSKPLFFQVLRYRLRIISLRI